MKNVIMERASQIDNQNKKREEEVKLSYMLRILTLFPSQSSQRIFMRARTTKFKKEYRNTQNTNCSMHNQLFSVPSQLFHLVELHSSCFFCCFI